MIIMESKISELRVGYSGDEEMEDGKLLLTTMTDLMLKG